MADKIMFDLWNTVIDSYERNALWPEIKRSLARNDIIQQDFFKIIMDEYFKKDQDPERVVDMVQHLSCRRR